MVKTTRDEQDKTTLVRSLKKFCFINKDQSTRRTYTTPDRMIQTVTFLKIATHIDPDRAHEHIHNTWHRHHAHNRQDGNRYGVLLHETHTSEYT